MNTKPYIRNVRSLVDDHHQPNKLQHEGGENDVGGINSKKSDKRILYVKKTQIDPTAVLSYSLGVSIVHLAMIVGIT
jgi:hypothetical protein